MTGGPSRFRPIPPAPTTLVLALVIAGLCALLISPGYLGPTSPAAAGSSPSSHTPTVAEQEVAAATQSLSAPSGPYPAGGSCTVAGSLVSCAAAPRQVQPLGATNDTPPQSWTDLTGFAGNPPSGRWIAAMTWDPIDHYVLLFGGYGSSGADSDTWSFVNDTWTALSTTGSPSARYAAGITWDYADGYAVLFGGTDTGATVTNDTWTYVGGTWTNITGTTNQTPGGRWRQGMTWDPVDGYVLMFGGTNGGNSGNTPYSDTWSYVGGNWTKLTVSGSPPARYRATMVWDTADGYAVTFGGCTTSNCPDSSTWTYVNATWSSVSASTHPSSRVYYGLAYSTSYDHVILWGGTSSATGNSPLSDTWAYANGTWTQLTSNLSRSPTAIAYLVMAFDPIDNLTVMYGGQWSNGTFSDKTWGLGAAILGRLTVNPGKIDIGQTTHLDAAPFAYANYVTYNYTTLPTGCTTSNVSVLSCTPSAIGTYSLAVVVNDSNGHPATFTGSVQVNTDPMITVFTVNRSTVTAGASVQFNVEATGGTGTYSYRYTGLPPGCGTTNVHNLTCTPGSTASGTYTVTATVTDQAGYAVNQTLSLVVHPTPTFRPITILPAVIDIGMTAVVWANVTPGTGTGPFSYAFTGLPTGCATTNSSRLNCTPTGSGFSYILVTVTDVFGFSATSGANLTVNVAPVITSSAVLPTPIDVGVPFSIWVNGSGGTGPLTYSYSGGPTGCSYGNRSLITCTPTAPGNYTITATATDLVGFSATTQLQLTVNRGFTSGGLAASTSSIDVGQNITLTLDIAGGTAPYSFSWAGMPSGCPLQTSVPTVTCTIRTANTYTISVTGTDHWGATVNGGILVIVNPAPAVTTFTASANPAAPGSALDLTLTVTGGSGVYTISYIHLPPGCTNANTTHLHCTPTKTGSYNITATVIDSLGGEASSSLILTVSTPSGGGALGSSTLLYVVIAVVVVAAAGAGGFLMWRRRRAAAPEPAEPAEGETVDDSSWQEPGESP